VPPVTGNEDAVGPTPTAERLAKALPRPIVEIRLAGPKGRVAIGADAALLTEMLRAVRASTA
jgi:hypothetical protein